MSYPVSNYMSLLFVVIVLNVANAQVSDPLYDDIYQPPSTSADLQTEPSSPLDGYSTVDDYYPEGGYQGNQNATTQSYTDSTGNTYVTNNYYGDYYEDSDYAYASRINRFHRYNTWNYYDPFYTNMYWYNYDPYFYGVSIYSSCWPSYNWYWGNNWGWNWGWNYGWGWNNMYGANYYGGWGWNYGWGWNNPYWNGYNNGYWNGFNDGLAYGGYYNTFDSNSGIYYGHRGSTGTLGSGYRNLSIADAYNKAASDGLVAHANKGNVLKTNDGRPVVGTTGGYQVRESASKGNTNTSGLVSRPSSSRDVSTAPSSTRPTTATVERNTSSTSVSKDQETRPVVRDNSSTTVNRTNPYQRDRSTSTVVPNRTVPSVSDRNRDRVATPQTRPQTVRPNMNTGQNYQRGNATDRYQQRPNQPATNYNRGNNYQNYQRPQNNSNYYRENNGNMQQSRPNNGYQYSRPQQQPQQQVPSRNYTQPQRESQPSRNYTQPQRESQPSRNYTPSNPSKGSSPSRGGYEAPSRPNNSGGSMNRGGGSMPSQGGSMGGGSRSRGGR